MKGMHLEKIVLDQREKLAHAYTLLHDVMPEFFFRSLGSRLGEILPLLCDIEHQKGCRRTELDREVFLIYLKSDECNPVKSSRMMAGQKVSNVTIHQSLTPLHFAGGDKFLVVEHYMLGNPEVKGPHVTFEDLLAEYMRQFGECDCTRLENLYRRINFAAVADLDLKRLAARCQVALKAENSDVVHTLFEKVAGKVFRLTVALPSPVRRDHFFSNLMEVIDLSEFEAERVYFRDFSSGSSDSDFERKSVQMATLYLHGKNGGVPKKAAFDWLNTNVKLLSFVEMDDLLHYELVRPGLLSLEGGNLLRAVIEFIHSQLAFADHNAYTLERFYRLAVLYPDLSVQLVKIFKSRFDPASKKALSFEPYLHQLSLINSGYHEKDQMAKLLFRAMAHFVDNLLKCNVYVTDKSALSFRLNGSFVRFYREMFPAYAAAFPADEPYGVFYFYRRKVIGFQIRFAEIARGGWRSVIPRIGSSELERDDYFTLAREEVFREGFVLAHTQHLKNKDIYEGGSKMITLLAPVADGNFKPVLWEVQRAVAQAFLSLINYTQDGVLKDPRIVDYWKKREIIEIGPDENMFDEMIEFLGELAQHHGYTLGSGIISGKGDTGFNHKEFGVTSFGVLQYVLKTLRELGIEPEKDAFSVKIAGGPSGDVAGNMMKLLLAQDVNGKDRYPNLCLNAVTDGPAAIYDPAGIDKDELRKLLLKKPLDGFDPAKLRGEGAYMVFSRPIVSDHHESHRLVKFEKGRIVDTEISRDEYMDLFQHNLCRYADLFIPAGGRPSTINEGNYTDFFCKDKPSFRAIVEGANSFITPRARELIQEKGVWIVKDASANKCGVITSSYEILSGLLLTPEEFHQVHGRLIGEVMAILKLRAEREAEYLYGERSRTGEFMTVITDRLSREINRRNDEISAYLGTHPELISDELILSHLPPLFSQEYRSHLTRLPSEYRQAIASVELACRMVYASGAGEDLGERIKRLL